MYENVYTPVTSIEKLPVKTSGLCKIVYFKWDDVFEWPEIDPETGIISTIINLKPGGSFYIIECADTGRIFNEDDKMSDAGPFCDMLVTAQLGANTPNNLLSLMNMRYHKFGLIVYDRDGNQRLIGNEDSGAKLVTKYTSGDFANSRQRKLQWSWQHSQPAPIYSSQEFSITIGGVTITTGCVTFVMRFRVGDPGAPMTEADTTLTDSRFANKKLLVIASSLAVPCDDGSGDIDWTGSIERHYLKTLEQDTITWYGGVTDKEIIEIYAFS